MGRIICILLIISSNLARAQIHPQDSSAALKDAYGEKSIRQDSFRTKDYFLSAPHGHHYSWFFPRNENDTLRGIDTVYLSWVIHNKDTFYFYCITGDCSSYGIIGSNSFLHGVYCWKDGRLFIADAFWYKDLAELDAFTLYPLFPLVLMVGDTFSFHSGIDCLRKFEVLGTEDVLIGKTFYQGLLKIKLEEIWPENRYTGYVWLKKGAGVVKWLRFTGRTDVLIQD